MRPLLPAVCILLALLCAWLVFQQPADQAFNEAGGVAVQEESLAEPAPAIEVEELAGSAVADGAAQVESDPAQREAVPSANQGMAEIEVKVMRAESNQAIRSMEVRVQRIREGIGSTFGDATQPIESVRTDDQGIAILQVPPGEPLLIAAGGQGQASVVVSPAGEVDEIEYDAVHQNLEALQIGERVEVELRLQEISALFWFRLVDAQSGEPLSGAKAVVPHANEAVSDQDGLISVEESHDYFGEPIAIFEHEGYGPRRVILSQGGEAPEQAFRVELYATASLHLTVLKNGLPLDRARIAMHYARPDGGIESLPRPRWGGKPRPAPFYEEANGQGEVSFERLPAHQALVYGVASSFGSEIAQRAPEVLTLQPGERRKITWEVGNQQDLLGRVIDTDGAIVAGAKVWLLNSGFKNGKDFDTSPVQQWATQFQLASTASNEAGEFAFEQINPGEYWLALAPSTDASLVAMARRVTVPALSPPEFVELQYASGWTLSGLCVDLQGEALSNVEVIVIETASQSVENVRSDDQGKFRVGPYPAGAEIRFHVFQNVHGYVLADPVTVIAGGEQEVVLRMAMGGVIRGRVVDDQDGSAVQMGVLVSSVEEGGASGTNTDAQGRFNWKGLASGTWRVVASNQSGWIGVSRPIVLGPEDVVEGVEVRVAQGGTLIVINDTQDSRTLRLNYEGWTVDFMTVAAGERRSQTVPIGTIDLEALEVGESEMRNVGQRTFGPGESKTFRLSEVN